MSLHSQFATNVNKEIEGVEVQYGPNKDKSIPTFTLSRMGKSNKRYSKALESATRPYRRQLELGTLSNDVAENLFRGVFVDTVLKSWANVQVQKKNEIGEGLLDEKGNAVMEVLNFDKVNAIRLFEELPELYEDLQEKAKSAALFREESLEDEAGN